MPCGTAAWTRIEQEKTTNPTDEPPRVRTTLTQRSFAEVKVDEQLGVIPRHARLSARLAAGRILNTKTASRPQILGSVV